MFNTVGFVTYMAANIFTPGPNNLLSMSNSSKVGFKRNFKLILGMLFGITLVTGAITAFSSILFDAIPSFQIYMKIVGALYMLYLIAKTWIPKKEKHDENSCEKESEDKRKRANTDLGFWSGAVLQLINPKLYLGAFTAMSTFVLPVFTDPLILICFVFAYSLPCFLSISAWGLFGSLFKKVFDNHPIVINIVITVLLLYCAVSLFF